MPDHSVHKAADLAHDEGDHPHGALTGDERQTLRREIVTQAQEIGSRVKDSNKTDIDTLLDEAFGERRRKHA